MEHDEQGRLNEAFRTQDRATIRAIMAARQAREREARGSPRERELRVGALVELHSLKSVELNGVRGTVVEELDPSSHRIVVNVAGKGPCALKPGNCRVLYDGHDDGDNKKDDEDDDDDDHDASSSELQFKESDYTCAICYSLLYKPCVNNCGHVFCFWCLHHAMDYMQDSHCPLCRAY